MNNWVGTVSGEKVDLLNPNLGSINIVDIATGLAKVSRFSGQIDRPYSVAEHSICVAKTVYEKTEDPVIALQGLLHDASEAYMGDTPKPVKNLVQPLWGDIETAIMNAVYYKWDIPRQMNYAVREADARWCLTEKLQLQPNGPSWDNTPWATVEPYSDTLHPAPSTGAVLLRFLLAFDLYTSLRRDVAERSGLERSAR